MRNVPTNVVTVHLAPYRVCVVIIDHDDGTSLVAHEGTLAYAVTECLVEV